MCLNFLLYSCFSVASADKWSDQQDTMSSFQVVDSSPGSSVSVMETSNFAHVIFQNVGKSFLPQAPLECRYTLTPYIVPHPKDWVGIFKVHNSTAAITQTVLQKKIKHNLLGTRLLLI